MIRTTRLPSLLCTTALVVSTVAVAGEAAAPRVNGVAIPAYRIDHAVRGQLAQGQKETPDLQKAVRDILINQEVVAQAAARAGLDKRPAVAAQLEIDRAAILMNAYFADYFSKNPIPEEAIRK
jgi:peptidyl-prolyl cis-trans isomerase C